MYYFFLGLYILFTSCGLLLMKLGAEKTGIKVVSSVFNVNLDLHFLCGALFYVCSFLIYAFVLQRKDLSYVYPLCAGIVNVASVILGVLVLSEKLNIWNYLGMVCIVIGVIAINIGR